MADEYGIQVKTASGTVEVLRPGMERRIIALENAEVAQDESIADAASAAAAAQKTADEALADSGVEAGSYGPTTNISPEFGASFVVPTFVLDKRGRATSAGNKTVTLPSIPDGLTVVSLRTARVITLPSAMLNGNGAASVVFDGSKDVQFSCNSGCTGSCGENCSGSCSATCVGSCSTSCTGGCQSGCSGSCKNSCSSGAGDSCFVSGDFVTRRGRTPVETLAVGDAVMDVNGVFHEVLAVLSGEVGDKRVVRAGNAVMTEDHIVWDHGPASFLFPGDESTRVVRCDGQVAGRYLDAPKARCTLPFVYENADGRREYCPVVAADGPVWADFSGVIVQLAVAR